MSSMNRILLIFCFVGLSLGQLARITLTDGVAFTLLDVAVVLFVGYSAYDMVRKKERLKGVLLFPIGLFVAACIISLLVNLPLLLPDQFLVAVLYLFRWVLYAGVYFSIVRLRIKDAELIRYFIFAGIVQLFIGIIQYFYFSDLRKIYYLGWDDHLYRLVGAFIDPNYQGAFFVLLFILLFIQLVKNIKKYRRPYFIVSACLTLLTLTGIVLTYSRSALVMLAVSLIGLLMTIGNKKLVIGLSVCTLVFVILFSNTYIEGLNPFRTASVYARISSVKEVSTIIADNPVFGIGFNAFRYAQHRYGYRTSERWQVSHADAGTDNSFLFVFATTGILGLLAYLNIVKESIRLCILKMKKSNMLPVITCISLIGLIVDSFFVNSLLYSFFMFWIWILLGATESR